MLCSQARTFLSQVADKSVSAQIQQADLDFLVSNGYLFLMQKEQHDQAVAEVSNLAQMNIDEVNTENAERAQKAALDDDERKVHSIMFHFEKKEEKDGELEKVANERNVLAQEDADVVAKDAKIKELIEKKSALDRMTAYDGKYLALTGQGVITLNDLNVRNYRVSDTELSGFLAESKATNDELQSIAEKSSLYMSSFKVGLPEIDASQLWSVSVGLAKLQGETDEIRQRFYDAYDILKCFKSTTENKLMASEIMTSFKADPTQAATNADLQNLSESLINLDKKVRHDSKVPKQLSAGVAATLMFGRRFDGTFPTDNFAKFCNMTPSYETAAILSIMNVPADELSNNFQSFRWLFDMFGYERSEDTELASAYLAISDLKPEDVQTKLTIIIAALKNYLEYPLVASAILASIPTLEANETLDLMHKAYTIIGSYTSGLSPSELLSLSVRMIHGIRNEIVKKLDPTAKITNTPMQFTYAPSNLFFIYRAPLIIAHSSYFTTYSGIGGFHPAHVHGVGGFMG